MCDRDLILVDCDGVISDIYGASVPLIRERFKDDPVYRMFGWDMVKDWEMTSVRKDVAEYFLDLAADPAFMATLPVYKGAVEALRHLQDVVRPIGYTVSINTVVFNQSVGEAREAWILDLKKRLHPELLYHIHAGMREKSGKDKPPVPSLAIIEDNLHIIRANDAVYSYIINHHHNGEETNRMFVDVFKKAKRVDNLMEAVVDLEAKFAGLS